jgi:carboxyl-terminal processing protease
MRILILVLVALAPSATRAEPFTPRQALNVRLVADVFASAYTFMAPRTLEPISVPTLALWTLEGLATLDPRLRPELREGSLLLTAPGRVLAAHLPPAAQDARGWGEAVAALVRAGWDASELVRNAGTQDIVRALFGSLCGHLDPYSHYAAPADANAERARRNGIGSIGAHVVARRGGFVLREVTRRGPAAAAGVRAGDRLLAVDGVSTQGLDLSTVTALLAGPEGTRVVLTLGDRHGDVRDVTVERALLLPRTVAVARQGDVLVVRVTGFSADTGAELAELLSGGVAGAHRPRGVVLDLRGNRGGLLHQAVAAAETILPNGIVATTMGRDPDANHTFIAHGTDLTGGLPTVVMVDGMSASAAEVLAAALADGHRAVVVGSSTFGKGLVQTIAPLPDGGELFLSWSEVIAPLGWPLQGLGVLPQVCTSLGVPTLWQQLGRLSRGEQPMAAALVRHHAARPPLSPNEVLEIRNACPAAEGSALDLTAARRLIHDPAAYAAALLGASQVGMAATTARTSAMGGAP